MLLEIATLVLLLVCCARGNENHVRKVFPKVLLIELSECWYLCDWVKKKYCCWSVVTQALNFGWRSQTVWSFVAHFLFYSSHNIEYERIRLFRFEIAHQSKQCYARFLYIYSFFSLCYFDCRLSYMHKMCNNWYGFYRRKKHEMLWSCLLLFSR